MKYYLFLHFLFFSANCFAQNIFLKQPATNEPCVLKEENEKFNNEVRLAKQAYYASQKAKGIEQRAVTAHVLLGWPMRVNSDYDFQYNYFNLQNYVDQLRPGSGIQDYGCGGRTYNDHDASDINLFPFWWRMMDNNAVMAVAAAPGIILPGRDFNLFDRNCTQTGSANNITILHDDGTTTRYLHLKKNSLTTKPDNERVEQGEFLGFIGSSGRSSNPHLHFAVYDSLNRLVEPFFNYNTLTCNFISDDGWWQNQRSYWEPQINRLMTHSAAPSIAFCPADEIVNAKNQFNSGDIFYTGIAFMDGQNNDVTACSLLKPNGVLYDSWNVTLNQTYSRQYEITSHLLPSANTGTWTFKAVYRSKTYVHFFTVGCKSTETISGTISGNDGYITSDLITSTAVHTLTSNSKVLYQSANTIELKPGFEIKAGVHFKARIKPCDYVE